ncbi:6-phosphogluconate dehydrogenase (decarboxylating) [Clostridium moniliforme]|uniref:6-phosphogluconate dehydrogenase (Decarboxylating) n=1 Tax=Clostridium moniliforme TaxID=39489 RepID=A0ABS4F251_9CLOT|nr:DUF3006 domain-containing protein [Clostridium moniliforme]MBP1890309.1 6-phosphogluconate dehydrogenase (decarboxylating) [Clostridium moniliforme]
MKEIYIVDRKEDKYYILESPDGEMINVNKDEIQMSLKEGDVLYKKNNKYYYDEDETQRRKKDIRELMNEMWVE